jgi:GlpG protein
MRCIGHIADESLARTFADYLYVKGIRNQVERAREQLWEVWIWEEDQIQQAADLLARFTANPADPEFGKKEQAARELRSAEEADQQAYERRVKSRRHLFRPLSGYGVGPLTFILISISIVVFALSFFADHGRIMGLFITDYSGGVFDKSLPEIRSGEVWRLLTPIFVHSGPLHIIFNMLCLRDLGSMIEARQTSLHLAIMVVLMGIVSNLAQFYIGGLPNFCGMSGVIYGLLGYVWLRGKFDPASGLFLHPTTVTFMIIWFFACFAGLIGNIANWAHAAGLVMGMAWGWLSSLSHR